MLAEFIQLFFHFDKDNQQVQQVTVKCIGTFVGHGGSVSSVRSYSDYFISGSMDGTIKFWDATTKFDCVKTLNAHVGGVRLMTEKNDVLYSIGDIDKKIMVAKFTFTF